MAERIYMVLFGLTVLAGLYFEINELLYTLVAISLLDGLINRRLIKSLSSATNISLTEGLASPPGGRGLIPFEALRAWRIVIAVVLMLSIIYYEQLWFLGWFLGFAVAGAGLSGVCPVLWVLYYVGFQ